MKILFLGYAVGYEIADCLSGISIAGNKMQVNLLKGFAANENVELEAITVYPVAAFPQEKKAYISKADIEIAPGIWSHRIPFVNFPIIKQFWQTTSVSLTAGKYADKDTVIFCFNLFPQVGLPAMYLKRKYGCRTCSLLADLPIDDNVSSKNIIRKIFRKIFDYLTVMAIKDCDDLVVLNRQAILDYAPSTPYIVVEGGIEDETILPLAYKPHDIKNIVYCGALTEYSGVLALIEAMKHVEDKAAVLEIYGGGYLTDKIKEITTKLSNVNYCGKVSNKKMIEIQRCAYLLVNPRPVNDRIARVTFPSKMFEYMMSGTPVLTTKLNGLSEDFLHHLYSAEDGTVTEFAEAINKIMKVSQLELQKKAAGAYEFIVYNKTWSKQNKKIYEFLKERST